MIVIRHFFIFWAICLVLTTQPAWAQNEAPVDIIPAVSYADEPSAEIMSDTTHAPVRLTPDKSELIRLDKKAGTIIVGNPAHVSVLADSAQTLVLVPKLPGATYITVLDQFGEVLMARHIIVASPQKKYVRIRKSCAGSKDDGCQATQVYYCPDMCHEISLVGADSKNSDSPLGALEELIQNAPQSNEEVDTEATEE